MMYVNTAYIRVICVIESHRSLYHGPSRVHWHAGGSTLGRTSVAAIHLNTKYEYRK